MKIAIVHNRYAQPGRGSGEEVSLENIARLLEKNGHQIALFVRSSHEIQGLFGKFKAFFSGIYNLRARREMSRFLRKERPDIVLVQNVFPLISPSVLLACRAAAIPVVMRCPNYRLLCPNGLFMVDGKICERCAGGNEYWCLLRNCEGSVLKSLGYFLRSFAARKLSLFKDNVDIFMVQTQFAKNKLIRNGFAAEKIHVIYGQAVPNALPHAKCNEEGTYAGYVGRLSNEKGIDILLRCAAMLPHIQFRIAGKNDHISSIVRKSPANVEFVGQLAGAGLSRFYADSKMIIVPSQWYEGLPSVFMEAMLYAKPVICSNIGGLPEVVDEGQTGLLFQHDNVHELVEKVQTLWQDTKLCKTFGEAGRKKAMKDYSPEAFYCRLSKAFDQAIDSLMRTCA